MTSPPRSPTSAARWFPAGGSCWSTWQPLARQRVDPRDLRRARRRPRPAGAAARRARPVLPVGPRPGAQHPDGCRVHRRRAGGHHARACGSAPTPTTPTGSCSGSWAGCSKGSTTPAGARAVDELRTTMAAHETSDGVVFGSAAWTITRHPGMTAVTDDARARQLQRRRHRARRGDTRSRRSTNRRRSPPSNDCAPLPPSCSASASATTSSTSAAAPATSPAPSPRRVGPTGTVVGIDASETMLTEARRRTGTTTLPVEFRRRRHHRPRRSTTPLATARCASASSSTSRPARGHGRARPRHPTRRTDRRHRHRLGTCTPSTAPTRPSPPRSSTAGRATPPTDSSGRRLPALFADAGLRDPIVVAETMTSTDPQRPRSPPFTTMAAVAEPRRGHQRRRRRDVARPARRRRPPRPLLLGRDDVRRRRHSYLTVLIGPTAREVVERVAARPYGMQRSRVPTWTGTRSARPGRAGTATGERRTAR